MKIGYKELEINGYKLIYSNYRQLPSSESLWAIVGLHVPRIFLPFYRRNEIGEWERTLEFSFPTFFEIMNIIDISWEFQIALLGFGCSLVIQFGY